jgi:hypothetical protein
MMIGIVSSMIAKQAGDRNTNKIEGEPIVIRVLGDEEINWHHNSSSGNVDVTCHESYNTCMLIVISDAMVITIYTGTYQFTADDYSVNHLNGKDIYTFYNAN